MRTFFQVLSVSLVVARKPHTAEKAILQSITSSVREVVMIDYGTLLRDHVNPR